MELGLIGLGKMGGFMRDKITSKGHKVIGYDPRPEVSDTKSLKELVEKLPAPRTIWVMVPAGKITTDTINELSKLLEPGDLVIDGGNTKFTDDVIHAKTLNDKQIRFVDCGVSGGVWGKELGYGLMAGGDDKDIEQAMPIFDALRPDGDRKDGFVHVGPVSSGHYVKMIHNGIEYGLMQSYAEGFEILESSELVKNTKDVLQAWTKGTVIRSWLLDLLVRALEEDKDLKQISGYTEDSGEGRWTIEQAIQLDVPVPVISAALYARIRSRQQDSLTMKAVAALRNQFGGHAVTPNKKA